MCVCVCVYRGSCCNYGLSKVCSVNFFNVLYQFFWYWEVLTRSPPALRSQSTLAWGFTFRAPAMRGVLGNYTASTKKITA